MAGTGYLAVSETVNGGRSYNERVNEDAASFDDALETLHMWLWLTQSQAMALHVIRTFMRGEIYSDHSVCVRYYVPGTVGHWYDILYRA